MLLALPAVPSVPDRARLLFSLLVPSDAAVHRYEDGRLAWLRRGLRVFERDPVLRRPRPSGIGQVLQPEPASKAGRIDDGGGHER
jgi:hypothetical protein